MAIVKGVMTVVGAWFIVSGLFVLAYSSLKMYAVRKYALVYDNETTHPPFQPASAILEPAYAASVQRPAAFQTLPGIDSSTTRTPAYSPASST